MKPHFILALILSLPCALLAQAPVIQNVEPLIAAPNDTIAGMALYLLADLATDHRPLVRHAGHGWFSELISRGVRIYEYQGPMLHAKTLVADGYASVVGSTNLDFRSFHFNAECNLVILDEDSGNRIATAFRRDLGQAREIELGPWRSRPWLHRLGDRVCRWLSPVL